MRKWMMMLLILGLLAVPVLGAEAEAEAVLEGVPQEAQAFLPQEDRGFLNGVLEVVRKALLAVTPGLPQAAAACAGVLAAAILCALFRAGDEGLRTPTADILGAVAIASLLLQPTDALIQSGLETVQAISDYGKLLLPVMSAALVASGGTTTASALYMGTAMFDSLLTGLLAGLLGPLMYLFLSLSLASAAIGNKLLGRLRDFFKTLITWALKLVLSLFTGYMAITGVISGTADAAAVKVTKMAISGAVPVVGGMLSNATETVLAGAAAVRSTAGVLGLLAILAITAAPFFEAGLSVSAPEADGGPVRRGGERKPHGPHGELCPGHGAAPGHHRNLLPNPADQHGLFYERSNLMDAIRRYVITLTAAAMLCALVKAITAGRKGQEKILSLVCGIFLLATALGPLGLLRLPDLSDPTAQVQAEAGRMASQAEDETKRQMAAIISEEAASYILDKADALGLQLEVQVELDAELLPCGVRLQGAASPYARSQLSGQIETELGIPKERQVWSS